MKAHKFGDTMKEDTRIALLEQSIGHINEALIRIEKRLDSIDSRFDKVDDRINGFSRDMNAGFNILNSKIDSNFKWLLSVIIGCSVGSWGVLAHIFHWF